MRILRSTKKEVMNTNDQTTDPLKNSFCTKDDLLKEAVRLLRGSTSSGADYVHYEKLMLEYEKLMTRMAEAAQNVGSVIHGEIHPQQPAPKVRFIGRHAILPDGQIMHFPVSCIYQFGYAEGKAFFRADTFCMGETAITPDEFKQISDWLVASLEKEGDK